jgi:transposase
MNKSTNYYGIDISKDVFDVTDQKETHYQFTNDFKGFKKFKKLVR